MRGTALRAFTLASFGNGERGEERASGWYLDVTEGRVDRCACRRLIWYMISRHCGWFMQQEASKRAGYLRRYSV